MSGIKDNKILSDVKLALDLNPDEVDADFDKPIISKINNAIGELAQLGLRNLGDFLVESGDETWNDLLGEDYQYVYAFAKNYIEIAVKLQWDTPQGGALKAALDEQFKKAEFNVMTAIEHYNLCKEE